MKLNSKSINYNVQTVDELVSLDGLEGDTVVVTDEDRGGVFVYREDNVGTNNGGTIFNGWNRQYEGAINVKWFGAKGDGVTDDTLALNELSSYLNNLSEIDIEFNEKDIYLLSYNSLLQKDDYSSYVFNLDSKNKISIKGNNSTIKLINHNITINKGFTFALINDSNNVDINNFTVDFTFTGVNTSSSYYPQCCAFKAIGTCKNINISDNKFSMFHPYGQMALSGTNYNGDTNNGFKIIPIGIFGDTSETDYMNLPKNINITNNVFLETHNAYGIWVTASTDVNIEKNKALKWVGKASDQNGNIILGSYPFIRYVQFYGQNLSIVNNSFNARAQTDRPSGYEGAANFISLAQNITSSVPYNINVNVAGNHARLEATENTISGPSTGIYLNLSGNVKIVDNTIKIISYSTSFTPYGIKEDNSLDFNGVTRDIIINNNFISGTVGTGYGVYLMNAYSTNTNKMNLILSNNLFDGFETSVSLGGANATYYGLTSFNINGNNFINETNPLQLSNTSSTSIGSITDNISNNGTFIQTTWTLANKENITCINNKYNSLGTSITEERSTYQSINNMVGKGSQFSLGLKNNNNKGFTFVNQESTAYIFTTGSLMLAPAGGGSGTEILPYEDNKTNIGAGWRRWATIYAGTGTINTSDEREKTFYDIEDAEIQCAKECKTLIKKFKFNSSIVEKGEDKARLHFGSGSQTIQQCFIKHGLNPENYGIFCYDKWEETPEVKDEEGNIIQEYVPAGDRYGLRYDELAMFILGAL